VASAESPAPKPDATRVAYVADLVRQGNTGAQEKLVQAYGEWSTDPSAADARTLALGALLREPQLPLKVSRVLQAVAGSKIPPEQDPVWPRVVESLAALWDGADFNRGRDLMMMETRPIPRRALIESFGALGTDRMTHLDTNQRNALLADLIDIYHDRQTAPETKPKIEATVRALGGDDLGSVLAGADVNKGSKHPAIVEYERQLTEAEQQLLKKPPKP
jgi:hypothetical protein